VTPGVCTLKQPDMDYHRFITICFDFR